MKLMPQKSSIKILFIVFLILIPIVIPFTLLLSNQFSRYAFIEINKFNQDKVTMTAENLDFFLSGIKSYGFRIYEDTDIQNWLNSNEEDEYLQNSAQISAKKYLYSQPYIYSCYMVNMLDHSIFDTSIVPNSNYVRFSDDEIQKLIMGNHGKYLSYVNYTDPVNKKSYFALIYPSNTNSIDYYGYIVLFMDKDLLKSFYMKNSDNVGTEVFLLDDSGKILISSNSNSEKTIFDVSEINKSLKINYHGAEWSVNSAKLESLNWTLLSMNQLRQLSKNIISFNNRMIAIFVSFFIILLAVVYWNSLRTYQPLYKLSQLINQRKGKQTVIEKNSLPFLKNEFKYLQRDFQLYLDKMDKVNKEMSKHRNLIREEYLRQWILQGRPDKNIIEYLESERGLLQYPYISIAVIRIDSYQTFCEENDFSSRKLMKFAMGNIANELMEKEGWYSECVDLGSDHIVLLIGRNEEEDLKYISSVKNIGTQISNWLKISTSLASSKNCSINDDVRRIYNDVLEFTMLKFISGQEKVYVEEDYEELMEAQQPIPDEGILDEIINTVRLGKGELIKSLLNKLFEHMKKVNYESCKLQLTYIVFSIAKAFSKMSTMRQMDNIMVSIDRFKTLQDFRDWMETLLMDMVNTMNNLNSSGRKEEIASEIVEYIKGHINDPMLTQEEIATHLSLSYSYIRYVFKEIFNTTLADYIVNERINKIKNLLLSTDIPVTEIAERSGFQTKSHFFTIFKKNVGLTPNEFRLQKNNLK